MGWIKGNFDGATKGNPRKGGCGGVLRDHTSRIVDAIAIPIGIPTSHKAEATTTLYTMGLVVDASYHNIWMEGDSLNIINMLNNKNLVTWTIEGSIMEIKNLINKFENVIFSHIFWEGNSIADWIANHAIYRERNLRWHADLCKDVEITMMLIMIGHMLEKERFPKIRKFMKKSGGFTKDTLRFPRNYLCTIMTFVWHASKVNSSLIIFKNLLPFLVFATLVICRKKYVFEMGGEPRKQESSNCSVWKAKASM